MPDDHAANSQTGHAGIDSGDYTTFTAEAAIATLRSALPRHRAHRHWRLLRSPADNAVIHLEPDGLVARMGASAAHLPRLARELEVAAWLAARDIPAAVPATSPPLPQLAIVDGRPVTWWRYLPSTRAASTADLGRLLRTLHDQPTPRPVLPRLDPWSRVRHQIDAAAAGLEPGHVDRLADHWKQLRAEWDRSGWAEAAVVHGDAYVGNALVVDGRAHLLDFEDTALGPREWDLAAVAGSYRLGWTTSSDFAAFRSAYDQPFPGLDALDLLTRIILFRRCCWLASRAGREPGVAVSARQRISTLHLTPEERGWIRGGP